MEQINFLIGLLSDNKEWIFSGIGVLILCIFLKKKQTKSKNIIQISSKNSKNINGDNNQVG